MNIFNFVIFLSLVSTCRSIGPLFSPLGNIVKKIRTGRLLDDLLGNLEPLTEGCLPKPVPPVGLEQFPEEFKRCVRDLEETKGKKHPLLHKTTVYFFIC